MMPPHLKNSFNMLLAKCCGAKIDGRLGRRDLGRYAYEHKVPDWLYRLLEDEEKTHLADAPSKIMGILSKLLDQDQDIEYAFLCHSSVRYIGKVKVEGMDEGNHFCGYHNIQMLISYIMSAKAPGFPEFSDKVPTIWDIQEKIEAAWDQGFNKSGRVQTGGIRGTRKHIGTPEVQALFRSLKIPCKADRFEDIKGGITAYEQLLNSVEHYFSNSITSSDLRSSPRIQCTGLPPIYLQRPRHSLTVVGIERQKDGLRTLLVFDPAYHPSNGMMRMLNLDATAGDSMPSMSLMKPYRRGKKDLKMYHAFETLRLVSPA